MFTSTVKLLCLTLVVSSVEGLIQDHAQWGRSGLGPNGPQSMFRPPEQFGMYGGADMSLQSSAAFYGMPSFREGGMGMMGREGGMGMMGREGGMGMMGREGGMGMMGREGGMGMMGREEGMGMMGGFGEGFGMPSFRRDMDFAGYDRSGGNMMPMGGRRGFLPDQYSGMNSGFGGGDMGRRGVSPSMQNGGAFNARRVGFGGRDEFQGRGFPHHGMGGPRDFQERGMGSFGMPMRYGDRMGGGYGGGYGRGQNWRTSNGMGYSQQNGRRDDNNNDSGMDSPGRRSDNNGDFRRPSRGNY